MADVTTIEIATPAGPIDALLDVPEGQGPWPGVVVIHDAIGYGSDKESINARVARAGYIALTPNLFARGGWARCVVKVMRDLSSKRGPALDDVLAARDHLQALPTMHRPSRRRGVLHGGPVRISLVAQRFWRLGTVLRHSAAARAQRNPGRGMPCRGQLRRP